MYTAYVFLFFSYLTTNVLILRVLLILAAIFFILWGCLNLEVRIQIDTLCFNTVFILINLYKSIPLFKEVLPVVLTPLEEEVFNRDFKEYLTKLQFKYLISKFKLEHWLANDSEFCKIGNPFNEIIYIAKINPGYSVKLSSRKIHLKDLKESSWIGIIEYFKDLNKNPEEKLLWGANAKIHVDNDMNKELTANSNKNNDIGVYFYRFDLQVLNSLNFDPEYPFIFLQALKAIWLVYSTRYIYEQDQQIINKSTHVNRKRPAVYDEQKMKDTQDLNRKCSNLKDEQKIKESEENFNKIGKNKNLNFEIEQIKIE